MFFYAILVLTQFVGVSSILSSTFYLHPVLVLCFLLAFVKISIDPRAQESEDLKQVYGLKFSLKFSYLVEDKKPFFTRCYANGKDVIVCGHEIPM